MLFGTKGTLQFMTDKKYIGTSKQYLKNCIKDFFADIEIKLKVLYI